MGFYLVTVACLSGAVFSYAMMVLVKQKPPKAWGEWPYSKSRFAKWLEKRRENSRFLGPLRVDRFRLAFFTVASVVGLISLLLLAIDLSAGLMITRLLGEIAIAVILAIALLTPPIFEASLVIWWAAIDRHSCKNNQIKRIKQIEKKRNDKRKKQGVAFPDSNRKGNEP